MFMFKLNSSGDRTIRRLNLDSFYKGGTPFLQYEFIQIQNVISELILRYWKNVFSFQFPLNSSFKVGITDRKILKFKI